MIRYAAETETFGTPIQKRNAWYSGAFIRDCTIKKQLFMSK